MTLFGSRNRNSSEAAAVDRQAVSLEPERQAEAQTASPSRSVSRVVAFFAVTATVVALSACGQGSSKNYDISPIFPLSSDKCAKYGGTSDGEGFNAHCWVTKSECQQAAQDWRQAMQQGGVTDAIQFEC